MSTTPMMQQYLTIKSEHKDAFLFFRLGDFYEMFYEDAEIASKELEITLTSRDGSKENRVPMCGVPYHSAESYITQLIDKGYKIAICEQMEDPKQTKGMVKRDVVQMITPGTVMTGRSLTEKENNYIAAVSVFADDSFGLAFNDLTTGENQLTLMTGAFADLQQEIEAMGAKEVVIASDCPETFQHALKQQLEVTVSIEDDTTMPADLTHLATHMKQHKLRETFGRLLQYLVHTQKRALDHLQPVVYYETDQYMSIDLHSKRNLELLTTLRQKKKKGSLLWLLDETVTAMGGRLLKQWVERPLLQKAAIEERQSIVGSFIDNFFDREAMREALQGVYDLERLAGRVAFGNVNARDLIQLKKSLQQVPEILTHVEALANPAAQQLMAETDTCQSLVKLLSDSLLDDPPISVKEGGLMKEGYEETLDHYRHVSKNGKDWIAQLQQQEREATGIKSLKVGYNKVFGYYIEVTKSHLPEVPDGRYERKQTLANAERFITPELKEKERLILEAQEQMLDLEYRLFIDIREQVKGYIPQLQQLAKQMSQLDVLQSFAVVSEKGQYTVPEITNQREVAITKGRHPVVEQVLDSDAYVANDMTLDDARDLLLITGPNMAGKSTYMRQLALTAILTQIGCFVPAETAKMPIFDQVFTRIGAADDLVGGQSTFMVEMLETRYALSHATQNSLILLDEIGRGTSTYDGIALAQAIIEYIHEHIHAKTLFSTHYHELTQLDEQLPHLQNIHVGAIEEQGNIVFLHKVLEGAADESYGIHVAQLADLPQSLIKRARIILSDLEGDSDAAASLTSEHIKEPTDASTDNEQDQGQLSFFVEKARASERLTSQEKDVLQSLTNMDLLSMTPLDAINTLYQMQQSLLKKG